MESFNFFGNEVGLKSSNKAVIQKTRKFWRAFYRKRFEKKPKAVFEILRYPPSEYRPLEGRYFSNDRFLFLLASRTRITCYFDRFPWWVCIQYFGGALSAEEESDYLTFNLLNLLLRSTLKRLGLFQLHSAALSKGEHGILVAGRMGSGKTTTALSLVRENFKFIADDQIFLKRKGRAVHALGFDRDLFLNEETAPLFPELDFLKRKPLIKKGDRFKKFMSRRQFGKIYPGQTAQKTRVTHIFFPRFSKNGETEVITLSSHEAVTRLLAVESQETYPFLLKDDRALKGQLEVYAELCQQARCYDLRISGKDQRVAKVIQETLAITPSS